MLNCGLSRGSGDRNHPRAETPGVSARSTYCSTELHSHGETLHRVSAAVLEKMAQCSTGTALHCKLLAPDLQVGFQVYIDDKGAGACDVTA